MLIPLTEELLREADAFGLRSSCRHCLFFVRSTERCAHEWPNEEQKRWPLTALVRGEVPAEAPFCKEFELR